MSSSDKGDIEDAESLVDSFSIENDSQMQTDSYETLSDLPPQIMDIDNEPLGHEDIENEEELVQTEIVETEEIEIESEQVMERSQSPEEILPDIKPCKPVIVPPLRPLTIAPKPKQIPIAMKPVGGQQLLLVQGGSAGQTIKLVSSQGQEINLSNYTLGRPVTIKPTLKTLTTTQPGNISIVQQKPVIVKKIVSQKTMGNKPITFGKQGQQFMVVQKSDQQPVKVVQASGLTTVPNPTKTITLQQAQEMGLLTSTKIIPQGAQAGNKQTVLINKNQAKTIKIIPQGSTGQLVTTATTKTINLSQLKSPTKILPATNAIPANSKVAQRIIFKSANGNQTIVPTGQLIQVSSMGGAHQPLGAGQIHQINIPGKGMQYIKFVSATTSDVNAPTASVVNSSKTSVASTVTTTVFSDMKTIPMISKLAPKPLTVKTIQQSAKLPLSGHIVVPTSYGVTAASQTSQSIKVAIPQIKHAPIKPSSTRLPPPEIVKPNSNGQSAAPVTTDETPSNGMRPRKPCNCTKSQCLKLYCDCFANGEFCYMCNCVNCFNNLENEDNRNRAIKSCLERNPHAFRPKIGKAREFSSDVGIRTHTKGCNCKRSGCLKNYCECYEAKIACSSNCKCAGCRNIEDSMDKKTLRINTHVEKATNTLPDKIYRKMLPIKEELLQIKPRRPSNIRKQIINLITDDVIEATCQCMLTISDDADSIMQHDELTKKQIIEEFGRCLTEIINCSSNR